LFETNQEEATELPDQKQSQDKVILYKQYQQFAAGFGKSRGFHKLVEVLVF
jgi:hypothetical protein